MKTIQNKIEVKKVEAPVVLTPDQIAQVAAAGSAPSDIVRSGANPVAPKLTAK